MASEEFESLWRQAQEREHVRLADMDRLIAELGDRDIPAIGRLADLFSDYHAGFEQELEAIARATRMRIIPDRRVCPHCGDPNCPGAEGVAVIVMGAALLKKLLGQ